MKNKVLANHEVKYLVNNANKPPDEVKDVLSSEVSFWRVESPKLYYDWQLVADQDFKSIWIEYISDTDSWIDSDPPEFIVPKSKPNYIYNCE